MSKLLHDSPPLLKDHRDSERESKRERETESMSKLLRRCRQFPSFRRRSLSALNPPRPTPLAPFLSPRFSLYASLSQPQPHLNFYPHGNLLIRSFNSSVEKEKEPKSSETKTDEDYPSGEYEFKEVGGWKKFVVKLRTLIAFPWERIPNGSVLTMKLRGQISDELKSPFAPGLSLPQICENFLKAAYDPRISGIYLHIEPLKCGWGKLEEIRRHMLDFKKSGKFLVGYAPAFGEKEYYLACACEELYAPPSAYFSLYGLVVQAAFLGGVLEKVGIDPQVQKVGKYKSMGDQLACKKMTEETCEMLTSLLDNIHGNWLDKISFTTGKKREDIENFINEGVYQLERLKETGLITNIKYDDEVHIALSSCLLNTES